MKRLSYIQDARCLKVKQTSWTDEDLTATGKGQVAGSCRYSNENSGSKHIPAELPACQASLSSVELPERDRVRRHSFSSMVYDHQVVFKYRGLGSKYQFQCKQHGDAVTNKHA